VIAAADPGPADAGRTADAGRPADVGRTASLAAAGDEAAFAELTGQHRRELHVHCYRMLASFDDAEDAVQETFLRAWRGRSGLVAGQHRAWLYRIATNVCLDALRTRNRQVSLIESSADLPWLQPYPDQLLDEIPGGTGQPEQAAVGRETIELAFLSALQVLPPRQRAALLMRDVLGWPATDTAALLETSVAAANSALQRARVIMREHLPAERADWQARPPSAAERELLEQFMAAHERLDGAAIARIAAQQIRITMPPHPFRYDGLASLGTLIERAFGPGREGDWRLLPTAVNRMPTAASYLRRPGDSQFRPFKLDVLRVEGDRVAEITTFGPALFPALGLPAVLA
jgi:RNA polymerase sigma-70 factor (TIGR02960 family)